MTRLKYDILLTISSPTWIERDNRNKGSNLCRERWNDDRMKRMKRTNFFYEKSWKLAMLLTWVIIFASHWAMAVSGVIYTWLALILSYVFLYMHELQSMAFWRRKLRRFMSKLTFAVGNTLQLFIICLTKRKGSSHFSALVLHGTKDNLLTGWGKDTLLHERRGTL